MREILFRGKNAAHNHWEYGFVFYEQKDDEVGSIIDNNECSYDVLLNTLGQYTGVKDKNGTKIFEGDIVEYNGTKHRVVFENRFGAAYFGIVMNVMETWGFSNSVPANMMEVIGNIHDNPELLESEAE